MDSHANPPRPNDPAEGPPEPFESRFLPKCRTSEELLGRGDEPSAARKGRPPIEWTPEVQGTFLRALAACGVVRDAAKRAGVSERSAYYFRNSAAGGAFALAWAAAQHVARRRLADEAYSRAMHGWVEVTFREGVPVAERHRYDNRLMMSVLGRLDKHAEANDDESRAARFVGQEFEEFVGLIERGATAETAEFVAARERAERPPAINDAARNLERLERYRSEGAGLPAPANPPPAVETREPADAAAQVDAGAGSCARPAAGSRPPARARHDGLAGWNRLSEAEPEPPADDPVDRSVSLEQAEHEAAVRRYLRWKYPPEEESTSD